MTAFGGLVAFKPCDQSIWVHFPQIPLSLRKNGQEEPRLVSLRRLRSSRNMTGRPGYWTMEMNGGSSAPCLTCTPCVPLFVHCLIRVEAEGLLDNQGRAGIISIVRWNLRPVIFGVDVTRYERICFLRRSIFPYEACRNRAIFAIAMGSCRAGMAWKRFKAGSREKWKTKSKRTPSWTEAKNGILE